MPALCGSGQPIQREDQSPFARLNLRRTVDDSGPFVTLPFLAFEQGDLTCMQVANFSHIGWFGGRLAQAMAGHGVFAEPLASGARVSGDQPQRHVIHVKTRAHRLVQHAQAQPDAACLYQAGKCAHQPGDVGDKPGVPGDVLIGLRQG